MTSPNVATLPTTSRTIHQFPEFPPRDDMQNSLHLYEPDHQGALRRHFGNLDSTIIIGEIPLGWHSRQSSGLRIPDLLIAFDVDRSLAVAEMGYSINRQGKPPDFVLEIASPTTARNDEGNKRTDYANFGVAEYWRFDAQWGVNYDTGLAGDKLVDGAYQPIEIHQVDENRYWGHSEVLNLDLCWEHGEIRWYDPVAQSYLLTSDEEAAGRQTAESERTAERKARQAAESARIAERQARQTAESERDAERQAREAERQAAEARIRELEAENRRLRGE